VLGVNFSRKCGGFWDILLLRRDFLHVSQGIHGCFAHGTHFLLVLMSIHGYFALGEHFLHVSQAVPGCFVGMRDFIYVENLLKMCIFEKIPILCLCA
jgi:hypothetical protein